MTFIDASQRLQHEWRRAPPWGWNVKISNDAKKSRGEALPTHNPFLLFQKPCREWFIDKSLFSAHALDDVPVNKS